MMFALPNTQLTRRLRKEGRLPDTYHLVPDDSDGDQCTAGLNFTPLRPRIDILRDYLEVIETTYAPKAYFGRVRKVSKLLDSAQRHYKPSLGKWWLELKGFFRMARKLGLRKATRGQFWKTFLGSLIRNPRSIRYIGSLCALYVHFGPFSKYVADRIRTAIAQEANKPKDAPSPAPAVATQAEMPAAAK